MSATKSAIDLTKLRVGKAHVFIGSFGTADGLEELGICEGAISAKPESKFSTLTLPEVYGDAPLEVRLLGDTLTIDLPLIIGDEELWAKVAPLGRAAGGVSKPTSVTTTSLVIIPADELDADGSIGYATTTWDPAEPKHALFVHKGYFTHPAREYEHNETGSKKVTNVTFVAMQDTTKPEGFQLWFQGAAAAIAAGVTIAI